MWAFQPNTKLKYDTLRTFMVNEKKIFFPYRVQALLFSPILPFFFVFYNKHSFTFVYTLHLCSVQERLHKIHSRVG